MKETNVQSHYQINVPTLRFFIEIFSIKHSYFSSPITCHTSINLYKSSNDKDQMFGFPKSIFKDKSKSISLAQSPTNKLAQKAIH
jgi:hypothetical protein